MQEQRKTLASEMLRTGALLQSLSNMQQHTPVLRGLQPDLIKDPTTLTLKKGARLQWHYLKPKQLPF